MRQAKVNSRKFIAVFTAVCMLLTFMPMSVSAAETEVTETAVNSPAFQDVTGHWGQTAIEKWSGYGIINGYNGMFRPDDSITRGEMAVILDNLMDYQVAAENKFSDLKAGQFYTEAILKANAAGIIKGDGATVRPLDKITREESAVMMSRAFAVAESGSAMSFGDASAVSAWAKGAVAGMEAKGYVSGYAGKFDPKANSTRAAAVTMINNIVKAYYTKAGTYTDNVDGTAIIKVTDVILKGVTISGNLIIAEGVGKGDATLDNVTVKGETVVRGGGENSVHIIGSSSIASIRIEKIGDKLRIVVADGATVREVEVAVGEEIVITGTVGTLEVNAADAVVYATAAEITTATVNGDNSTIVVGAQSTINNLVVSSTADNTAIKTETGSVVKTVEASATVAVSGTGTVSTVTLKAGADGSSVTTPKTVVPVSTGVTGVTGTGGTAIPAGSSGTNGTSATAPATVVGSTASASSGGGGGGGIQTPEASDLTALDAALEAVIQSDYTIESWMAYQAIVEANMVSSQNSQQEVIAAVEAIIAAQANLVYKREVSYLVKGSELSSNDGYQTTFDWGSDVGIGSLEKKAAGSPGGYDYYSDGVFLRFTIKTDTGEAKTFNEVFGIHGDNENTINNTTDYTVGAMVLQTGSGPINDMDGSEREMADWGVVDLESSKTALNGEKALFYGVIYNSTDGIKTVGFRPGDLRTIKMKFNPQVGAVAGDYVIRIEAVQQGTWEVFDLIQYTYSLI